MLPSVASLSDAVMKNLGAEEELYCARTLSEELEHFLKSLCGTPSHTAWISLQCQLRSAIDTAVQDLDSLCHDQETVSEDDRIEAEWGKAACSPTLPIWSDAGSSEETAGKRDSHTADLGKSTAVERDNHKAYPVAEPSRIAVEAEPGATRKRDACTIHPEKDTAGNPDAFAADPEMERSKPAGEAEPWTARKGDTSKALPEKETARNFGKVRGSLAVSAKISIDSGEWESGPCYHCAHQGGHWKLCAGCFVPFFLLP